jgi:mRNA interferase RelE/StbE
MRCGVRGIAATVYSYIEIIISNGYIVAMKAVAYTTRAMRETRRLPDRVQTRIMNALRRETGEGDVKKLAIVEGYRLRIGDYRAIFTKTEKEIEVRAVRHRKDAYS